MTLVETLTQYLETSSESMRSLSLRSGLGEKVVADILRKPGLRPRATTLAALSRSTGVDLFACLGQPPVYYSDLIDRLDASGEARRAGRLRWMTRVAGWVPATTVVCRREVIEFLRSHKGPEFGLKTSSYGTYSSEVIEIVDRFVASNRKRGSIDLTGIYAAILEEISDSESGLRDWQVGVARPFLVFLQDQQIPVHTITSTTLAAYYAERVNTSSATEQRCQRHVIEVAKFLRDASEIPQLKPFGFRPVAHPFEKHNGRYGVADEVITGLMSDFDQQVAPWATGKMSRSGQPLAEFIKELDKLDTPCSDKKARLLQRRAAKATLPGQEPVRDTRSNNAMLKSKGFLTEAESWSPRTLKTRRGYIASLAKATVAAVDVTPETMEELLDSDFLETAVDSIKDRNPSEFSSGYLGSVLKCALKIARDFQCRSNEDLERITNLLKIYDRKRKGIAPRNRAKLRVFDAARIQKTVDLGDEIIAEVNAEIDRRREAHQKQHGILPPRANVIDAELGRDVMAVIAHEILLRNAPRSDNLIRARLEWISWQGEVARITVPAVEVKMRGPDDEPLTLYLNGRQSKLLKSYLETVRSKCLVIGDEQNPYLFPGQVRKQEAGQPYKTVLKRVTGMLNDKVGSRINPHLYRHLVGWIWLKRSIDNLPKVQRLLGHRTLQTTIDYYAELDPSLVFDEWNEHLNSKSTLAKLRKA